MSDIQQAINERIDAFVADITELAKKAALETLETGLSGGVRRTSTGKGLISTRGVRRKSGKRSPDEIQEAADQLLEFIRTNPGQRMEAIAKMMGSTTKDLTLPIKKLLQQNLVRVEGQKRATSYYPSTGKSARSSKKRRGRRKRA
jgi:predicted HTH transcriptional regulator